MTDVTISVPSLLQDIPACRYLRLPACLSAKQRAILHELAEQHGLEHASVGDGEARQLLLGHSQQPVQVRAELLVKPLQVSRVSMHTCGQEETV